tara:strand:- start:11809 stop:12018 length:210 start_codon:yes stop_codon:yes gene_type:complete
MNHIVKLQQENKALKQAIEDAIEMTIGLQQYYNSDKFKGIDNDYAHVTTDVYPKISYLKMFLAGNLNSI